MKVALALVADAYVESAAFVAWIKHVPAVVAVRVAEAVALESAHVLAVPPDAMAKVVAPVPVPPDVVIANSCE